MLVPRKNLIGFNKTLLCLVFLSLAFLFLYLYYVESNFATVNTVEILTDKSEYKLNDIVVLSITNTVDQSSMLVVQTPSGEVYSKHLVSYPNNVVPNQFKLEGYFFSVCDCTAKGTWSIKHVDYSGKELSATAFVVSD